MYEETLLALSESGARYLVIGGIALSLQGYPRATFDLDILPAFDAENLDKIISSLKKTGYKPRLPVDAEQLKNPEKRDEWFKEKNMKVFSFIDLNNPLNTVDVMIYSPVDFEEAYSRKSVIHIRKTKIPVASIEDLYTLKKAAFREKDLNDLKAMDKILMKDKNG